MMTIGVVIIAFALASCGKSAGGTAKGGTDVHSVRLQASNPSSTAEPTDNPSDGVVVVQGIFDAAGERLLQLKPIHRYSYHSVPTPNQPQGRFAVIVTNASGRVTRVRFDALVSDDGSPGGTRHGFFEVVVPVQGKIASVCITDADRRKTFACVEGSEIR
jgi:hypothetical protein